MRAIQDDIVSLLECLATYIIAIHTHEYIIANHT